LKISNARIKAWRQCKCLHYYRYIMNLEKRRPPKPLIMGKIIHSLKEAIIEGIPLRKALEPYKEEYGKMFIEEREEYGDIIKDAYEIMLNYKRYYSEDNLKYLEIDGSKSEHNFKLSLTPELEVEIVVDAIAEDEEGRRWLTETKSFKRLPQEEVRLTDLQTTLYWEMLRREGMRLDGVMWDYIRSKPPQIPEETKKGELSRRKIDTLYEVYLAEIEERGLNPEDYQEILEDLKGREDTFFRRIYLPPSERLVGPLIKDFIESGYEIYYLGDSKIRTPSWNCPRCAFYQLCQAELQDLDVDYILKKEYKERRGKNDKEKEEEVGDLE